MNCMLNLVQIIEKTMLLLFFSLIFMRKEIAVFPFCSVIYVTFVACRIDSTVGLAIEICRYLAEKKENKQLE